MPHERKYDSDAARQKAYRQRSAAALTDRLKELKQLVKKGASMNTVQALQTLRAEINEKLDAMIARVRHSEAGYKAALTKGPKAMSEAARKAAATKKAKKA